MLKNKFILTSAALTVLFLVGGVFLITKPETAAVDGATTSANTHAVITETSYDWGEIKLGGGNVEKTFEIKNDGPDTLSLSNVITSCMCTTATLSLDGTTSPIFGMHTKSNYVLKVPSGETAELKVVFDPAFHGPSGVGPITRRVTVATNDPESSELNFTLTAMVRK